MTDIYHALAAKIGRIILAELQERDDQRTLGQRKGDTFGTSDFASQKQKRAHSSEGGQADI